jgi:hypothetical protein
MRVTTFYIYSFHRGSFIVRAGKEHIKAVVSLEHYVQSPGR